MLKEENITYLVGHKSVSVRPLVPYDPLVCGFLNSLSTELRSHREVSAYPDIMTFAFWCRKANITRLKSDFEDGKRRLGLGLVFHITPSNVPINFVYSFAFGLLSGNANIVRVPSKPFPQIDIVCGVIKQMLDDEKYGEIKAMTAFVKYDSNDQITKMLMANCNSRIIWGGDSTIKKIRKMPMQVRGVEIAFADRYSFCAIEASSIIELDEQALKQLAQNFFNDTYLMDQNACSSPHLVVWLGEENEEAKERFWLAVYRVVTEKYQLAAVNAIDKYTLLCHDALEFDGISRFQKHGNYVYRVSFDTLPRNVDTLRGRCGYFYEYDTFDMDSIAHIVNTKYQTLTYFGVDRSELLDFVVRNRLSGIDRIVPLGEALDIGVIWDGYDIVRSLSRIIDVK